MEADLSTAIQTEEEAPPAEVLTLSPALQVAVATPIEPGIRLEYPGRLGIRAVLGRLRPRSQRRLAQYCVGPEEEQVRNLVVEGDNLQVMASLYRFRGQIDLIVADPPYNTGNDFRYNDRWDVDPNDPDPGTLVGPEDGGRHSKWMRFIAPRLEVMRAMLKPGGVCAICIDERELFRLGMMMDETFGEHNRLAIINWQKSYSAKNDSAHVSTATEYVLVYAKSREKASTGLLRRTDSMDRRYRSPDGDPEPWKAGDLNAKAHPKPEDYGIQSPFTGVIHYPAGHGRWRIRRAELKRLLEAWGSRYVSMDDPHSTLQSLVLEGTNLRDGALVTPPAVVAAARERAEAIRDRGCWPQVFFQGGGEGRPSVKRYLRDVKRGRVPTTYWADEDYETPLEIGAQSWGHAESGHSQSGINELAAIIGPKHGFETVKPLRLITKMIQLWCPPTGIVLDPFAGSGTTGHAVLDLNADTGASRRFILIEQSRPEKGDAYARTLTAERLRRVINGDWISGARAPLGGGFTFKTSTTQIDRKAVLAMQREEMCDLILLSHWDARNRKGPLLTTLTHKEYRYLVARDAGGQGYFLVWDGPNGRTPLTVAALADIMQEARAEQLAPPYHVYARTSHVLMPQVIFYQIPDEILAKMGFNDSLADADE